MSKAEEEVSVGTPGEDGLSPHAENLNRKRGGLNAGTAGRKVI